MQLLHLQVEKAELGYFELGARFRDEKGRPDCVVLRRFSRRLPVADFAEELRRWAKEIDADGVLNPPSPHRATIDGVHHDIKVIGLNKLRVFGYTSKRIMDGLFEGDKDVELQLGDATSEIVRLTGFSDHTQDADTTWCEIKYDVVVPF